MDDDVDGDGFNNAPKGAPVDPDEPGKVSPPPPQIPLVAADTLDGDITAAPSEIRSSTPVQSFHARFSYILPSLLLLAIKTTDVPLFRKGFII